MLADMINSPLMNHTVKQADRHLTALAWPDTAHCCFLKISLATVIADIALGQPL